MGFFKDIVSERKENNRSKWLLSVAGCMLLLWIIIVCGIAWKEVFAGGELRQQEQQEITKDYMQVPTEGAVANRELLQTVIRNLYASRENIEGTESINEEPQEAEISLVTESRDTNLEAGTDQYVFRYEYTVNGYCYGGKLDVRYEYVSEWKMASMAFTELKEWKTE